MPVYHILQMFCSGNNSIPDVVKSSFNALELLVHMFPKVGQTNRKSNVHHLYLPCKHGLILQDLTLILLDQSKILLDLTLILLDLTQERNNIVKRFRVASPISITRKKEAELLTLLNQQRSWQ